MVFSSTACWVDRITYQKLDKIGPSQRVIKDVIKDGRNLDLNTLYMCINFETSHSKTL